MDAISLVRVSEQGQIAEHRGVAGTIGTVGQPGLLPAAARRLPHGATGTYGSPGTDAGADGNDRELVVLGQAKG
jgi:hypothetical protein